MIERVKVTDQEIWISAAEAFAMVGGQQAGASEKICRRAHAGMVKARAARLIVRENTPADNVDISFRFWWAEGQEALTQDWHSGDFETWLNHKDRIRAYGVTFLRTDIEKIIPVLPASTKLELPTSAKPTGGRPPATWWDDLWIEMFRQVMDGTLQPVKTSDITKAMMTWISDSNYEAGETAVKERARKLFQMLQKLDGN